MSCPQNYSGSSQWLDYLYDHNGNTTQVDYRAHPTDTTPASSDIYGLVSGKNQLASVTSSAGTRSIYYHARARAR